MIKIGLDAGHGLYTAGKQTPDGIKEWTLNDKIRDKVVGFLTGYDCEFIHVDNNEGNTDESLISRVNKYLAAGVNVFVSLHHNAFTGTWNKATGVEVWVDRKATADDMRLAECIYKRLVEYTGLPGRGIKKENFTVINQNKIPAVLIEGGFMDSSIDYNIITSDKGQTAYAKAVAEGLIEYLNLKKKENKEDKTMVYTINIDELKKQGYTSVALEFGSAAESVVTPPAEEKPVVAVGATVKLKEGAKTYDGGTLADFVYKRNHKVKEIKGDRAVITYDGVVVAAVHTSDLVIL